MVLFSTIYATLVSMGLEKDRYSELRPGNDVRGSNFGSHERNMLLYASRSLQNHENLPSQEP
jgi:hypothetical protein